jgi:hypothetical protein
MMTRIPMSPYPVPAIASTLASLKRSWVTRLTRNRGLVIAPGRQRHAAGMSGLPSKQASLDRAPSLGRTYLDSYPARGWGAIGRSRRGGPGIQG